MSGLNPIAAAAIGALETAASQAASSNNEAAQFYIDLRDGFAKETLAQYATGSVVLVKPSQAQGADPLNPFSDLPTRTTRNAVVTGFPTDKIDGDRIQAADRRVLIDAADFTANNRPDGSDEIEIDGVMHAMVSLQAVPAAGVAVIYIMQARTAGRP